VDATQFQTLSAAGVTERQNLFGGGTTNVSYDGGTKVLGYWTPVRTQQQLDVIGFRDVHDTIVRVSKANIPTVEIGKNITIFTATGVTISQVNISEFGNSEFNPEWVLGCKALF
jgi:hypothetical protein